MKPSSNKFALFALLITILQINACSTNWASETNNSEFKQHHNDPSLEMLATDEMLGVSTDNISETFSSGSFASDEPYTECSSTDEIFCRSYPGVCKAYKNITALPSEQDYSMEAAISQLMDKNLICVYTYYTMALFQDTVIESSDDGYYPIEFRFFDNLQDFYEMVESTYSEQVSHRLIEGFVYPGEPAFIEKDGKVMYNPNKTGFTTGPYFSDIGYGIEITEKSETLCRFIYTPLYEKLSEEEYNELAEYWGKDILPHECEAVIENAEWRLNNVIMAF